MADDRPIFVAGAGAWGTALAVLLASRWNRAILWTRKKDHADALNEERENRRYLPGVDLPPALEATADLSLATLAEAVIFVVPAQHTRGVLTELRDVTDAAPLRVALCCKGLERDTLAPMHHVLEEVWPEAEPAVLSGPSFAADVARGLPTAVTLAAPSEDAQTFWLDRLATSSFRPYASDDLMGVELGGAVKNVLAIACGIAIGKGFGESAKAALIARGFSEFQRFGRAMGARQETMGGLSGLGDLVLTANSRQSRNFSLGFALGQGVPAAEHLAQSDSVAEGAATAGPLVRLAREKGVDLPIASAVASILDEGANVDDVITDLMTRPLTRER
ncbi:MAG: NAD(P)H-dependent glycerol-3-phosphate dehydrogenase [Pseudomonadota bacterium]